MRRWSMSANARMTSAHYNMSGRINSIASIIHLLMLKRTRSLISSSFHITLVQNVWAILWNIAPKDVSSKTGLKPISSSAQGRSLRQEIASFWLRCRGLRQLHPSLRKEMMRAPSPQNRSDSNRCSAPSPKRISSSFRVESQISEKDPMVRYSSPSTKPPTSWSQSRKLKKPLLRPAK